MKDEEQEDCRSGEMENGELIKEIGQEDETTSLLLLFLLLAFLLILFFFSSCHPQNPLHGVFGQHTPIDLMTSSAPIYREVPM